MSHELPAALAKGIGYFGLGVIALGYLNSIGMMCWRCVRGWAQSWRR